MKLLVITICLLGVGLLLNSCASSSNPPATVKALDKTRYAGEWHEIARLPNPFEKDLVAAKATYAINPDGTLGVLNEGLKDNGETSSIKGTAKPAGNDQPGKFLVRFDEFPANLFAGDYWILDVNSSYTRALVGSPDRKFLWLLSKNPSDQTKDFSTQIAIANAAGFETAALYSNPKRISR